MNGMTTWASPNGQRFQVSPDAIPGLEPFFQRLNELHPGYQSLGGYANRPMRTLDGRNLGGVSTHATGHTLDIKAPDHILRQMAQEFPGVKWGGNFKNHYDPVHFEFGASGAPKPAQAEAQPQQQQAAQPMNEPQQRQPSFLEDLQGRISSPMFQQGLGMFLAASQGGDLNQGMNAGQSRATSMREAMLKDMEIGQQRQQQQQVAQMLQNPQQFGNIPPALIEIAKATRNMGPVQDYVMKQHLLQSQQNDPTVQAELALKRAQTKKTEAEAADGGYKLNEVNGQLIRTNRDGSSSVVYGRDPVEQRRQQIVGSGLDPNSPQAKVFIATGKMPREDQQPLTATDKKAILEADEAVSNTQGVITTLNEAMKLSKKAYTGPTAGVRGYVGSMFGAEGAVATENMTNAIMMNALQSLKPIFGGNPTEGERKILIELQGSANKSQQVREDIFRRAAQHAQRRLQMNQQRANELRGGTFYKSDKPPSAPAADGWSIQKVE